MSAEHGGHQVDHLLLGEQADLFPGDRRLFDGEHVEAGIAKVSLHDRAGDRIVARADDAPGPEGLQGADLVHARGEDRDAVFVLPFCHDAQFAGEAVQHEGRSALGVDQVRAQRRHLGNPALVLRHDRLEFLDRAVPDAAIKCVRADAGRQQGQESIVRTGRLGGRLHHADQARRCLIHVGLSPRSRDWRPGRYDIKFISTP
jgi:hypothetical protein